MLKNRIIFIVAIVFTIFSFSQKIVKLNSHTFTIDKIIEPSGDDQKELLKLSRVDNNKSKNILTHITKEKWEDCNSVSLELGNYIISENEITLYSFWCRAGDAPVSPFGARLQTYTIDKKGNVLLINSSIYLEAGRAEWIKGLSFLFEKPKNLEETKQLKTYISAIETEYKAKFVFGKKAVALIEKVKSVLSKQIKKETSNWNQQEWMYGIKINL